MMNVLAAVALTGAVAGATHKDVAATSHATPAVESVFTSSSHIERSPGATEALATPVRVDGSLRRYDAQTRVISLETTTGELSLSVTDVTRIHVGHHRLEPARLASFIGTRVIARYVESAANNVLLSLRVLEESGRRESTGPRP